MASNGASDPAGRPPALRAEVVWGVLERSDEPFLTTTELVEHDAIDASRPTVLKRLEELQDEGKVKSKTAGQTPVWYVPPDDGETLSASTTADGSGASAVPEETYVEVQADLMAAARRALEEISQERDQPSAGWGEKARREAKTWVGYASKAALLSVVLFSLGLLVGEYLPGLTQSNIPVIDTELGLVWIALGILSAFGSLSFASYAAAIYAFARLGVVEWLEPRLSPYFDGGDSDGSN